MRSIIAGMTDLNRRKFLAQTAGIAPAFAGYSLLVSADAAAAPRETEPPVLESSRPSPDRAPASVPGLGHEQYMHRVDMSCDVFIAGGGMSGVCAALAAARNGAKVILVQDRSRLGGNASSEIKMHIVGADCHGSRPGWRESGIIEELRLDDAVHNSHRAYELWDLLLYDKVVSEPNIRLLLDTSVFAASTSGDRIEQVVARCDKTETMYHIEAGIYCDCTGDSRLALEAGADFRTGRESQSETGESMAIETADLRSQGSSILFTSREHDRPIPYTPPTWARKITKEHLKFRGVYNFEYGYWWIELGGMYDTIRDNERLRFELLSIVLGVWDYIKNSGNHANSENWALETVGMIPGKRESRRILGDHVMNQMDLEGGWKQHKDPVAIGGWNFDDHPPEGFDAPDKRPFNSVKIPEVYNIPLGALYSRNVTNLMMAGRNISSTHVAFTSARVMATCSTVGQATGTVASYCAQRSLTPRQARNDTTHLTAIQQTLLRDDQTIRNVPNLDANDIAREATFSSSSNWKEGRPEHVVDGITRDEPGSLTHRWASDEGDENPWIELTWSRPRTLSKIQITFDTGFHRELTLSASDHVTRGVQRRPQQETIRDYRLIGKTSGGQEVVLATVKNNYQRLRRHTIDAREYLSLRLAVDATNGSTTARVYEIRCYA